MITKSKIFASALLLCSIGLSTLSPVSAKNPFADPTFSMIQAHTASNLNAQRAQLSKQISAAQRSGQMSLFQANAMRAQTAQNADLQRQYAVDGVLTVAEVQSLINLMNGIDISSKGLIAQTSLINASRNKRGTHLESSSSDSKYDAAVLELDNKQGSLSALLEEGRRDGRLAGREYWSLKSEFDSVINHRQQISSTRARLSAQEIQDLRITLDDLASRTKDELATSNDSRLTYTGHRGHSF